MMICPNCKAEYRDGFNQCADCFVTLVVANPEAAEPPPPIAEGDLVPVYETGNPWLAAKARSLLESAGIDFATRGGALQDLFGRGLYPTTMNQVAGPIMFDVRKEDAAAAVALLADLDSVPDGGDEEADAGEVTEPDEGPPEDTEP